MFSPEAPKKSGSRRGETLVFKKTTKNECFFEFVFYHFVDQKKTQVLYMPLRGARPKKYCNLHIKMHIFNERFKNEAQKKHQKNNPKKHQKKALDPSKWSSRRDETLGFEKSRFLQKKRKTKKIAVFMLEPGAPDPVFYEGFVRFYD